MLSDRSADRDAPPIPSLLALRSVVQALTREGVCLNASIIVDSGEIRRTHDIAALIGFGATAVCPYLAWEIARGEPVVELASFDPDHKERNLVKAFEQGLLKVMSKMGISVVRSYQGAQLFTAIGLSKYLVKDSFPRLTSPIGGIGLEFIAEEIVSRIESADPATLLHTYQFKEHNRDSQGEKHSMTNARSRLIHKIVKDAEMNVSDPGLYREYLRSGHDVEPISIRHLLSIKDGESEKPLQEVQPATEILHTFGAGAMSFGAISAEAQRDIVVAALLGAEEFEFGKLLLIAEGCVMARICEKNTCPAGIATHDAKFKAKYKERLMRS